MSAKKIIGCCIAGATVCGAAVAAVKIVRDILEEIRPFLCVLYVNRVFLI